MSIGEIVDCPEKLLYLHSAFLSIQITLQYKIPNLSNAQNKRTPKHASMLVLITCYVIQWRYSPTGLWPTERPPPVSDLITCTGNNARSVIVN